MTRVFISGAGVVSPIGSTLKDFMCGVQNTKKGIGKISAFDTNGFPSDFGAEVKYFKSDSSVDRKEVFINISMEELFKSNKNIQEIDPEKRILNLGAGLDYFDLQNYIQSEDTVLGKWQNYSKKSFKIVEELAERFGIKGGFTVNVTACVASSQSMGLSFRMLKNFCEEKIVITGGFDSMLNHLHYMGFFKLGALSNWEGDPSEACRPFDKNRCGLVLGEGAAVFSFQNFINCDSESILAEIVGYSSTTDSYMVSDPDPEGRKLACAAQEAITQAGISPNEIDCVHLHGTGTYKNAIAESRAMRLIFSERFTNIPVFSLKGQVGHLIAACGAVEMLGVIYSLQNQQVPVTVNFKTPDPDVPLRVIRDKPLNLPIKYILKLNSAFGGQNTAFVVKKYEQ